MIIQHDELYNIVRRLAKTQYWQSLYAQAKEVSNISMFANQSNFTFLQLNFLQQLAFYSSLQFDIATNEVSELVLENEIYEDAYAYYRWQKRRQSLKKPIASIPGAVENINKTEQVVGQNQWVFTQVKGKPSNNNGNTNT